jgi:hypothetical protein
MRIDHHTYGIMAIMLVVAVITSLGATWASLSNNDVPPSGAAAFTSAASPLTIALAYYGNELARPELRQIYQA